MRSKIAILAKLKNWRAKRLNWASNMWRQLWFLLALWGSALSTPTLAQTKVFVASSLVDIAQTVGDEFAAGQYVIVGGASSTLARQIKVGAPADIFISAHREWADLVADKRPVLPILSNQLVLVSTDNISLEDITELPELMAGRRLTVGDPSHVPVGQYARETLEHFGLWASLERQLAPTDNVRAAAHLVRSKAVPFGIVYASDAKALDLHVAFVFPEESHTPIQYWAVLLNEENIDARAFVDHFLSGQAGKQIEQFGFSTLGATK
jgi:molybdate transport system substrate-binding protein